jgi:imidazolonepropionase-like amidohydrolase
MNFHSVRERLELFALVALTTNLFVATPLFGQAGEPRDFAIRGAKVFPVSSPPIENATILVSRGIIVSVGRDISIPPDTWVIDGKGMIVYPGLIDSLTDVGIGPIAPPAGAGPTPTDPNVRPPISRGPEDRPATTPWRNAADEINPADPRVESWRGAGFTTTVSSPKTGMFPGQAAVLDLAGERAGDLVVKARVAIPVSLTAAGGFRSFPGSQMGAIAYVRQVWLDTNWSSQAEENYDKNRAVDRPRYDRTEAVLAAALQKHELVLLPGNSTLQIRRALQLSGEWNLRTAIYGGQMSYESAPEIAAKKIPVLVDLKWPEAEKDADPEATPSLRVLRFRDRAPSSPAALEKAGVKFAFCSGAITTPKDLLPAVKKAIDAGLPADTALRALTLSPAEIFGVADVLGSIEKGKIANLVVTDGDLFDKKTKVKMVFVDGRKFEVREPLRPTEPPKGDLSGKWKLAFATPQGPEEATADLLMATDGTLTGTLTSSRGVGTIFTGYVSENNFNFTLSLPIEGNITDVTFTGTFEGTTMKGSISAMGYTFDFTGTKPTSAPGHAGGAL